MKEHYMTNVPSKICCQNIKLASKVAQHPCFLCAQKQKISVSKFAVCRHFDTHSRIVLRIWKIHAKTVMATLTRLLRFYPIFAFYVTFLQIKACFVIGDVCTGNLRVRRYPMWRDYYCVIGKNLILLTSMSEQ